MIKAAQKQGKMVVEVPIPTSLYLDSVMRRRCFPELHDLFMHAHRPAKELTESYAALRMLRPHLHKDKKYTVIHVGDGAHCRTAAMFAFLTKNTYNISVDPIADTMGKVQDWMDRFQVQRMEYYRSKIEDYLDDDYPKTFEEYNDGLIFTFVHAHVNVSDILFTRGDWCYAYTCACCHPGEQLVDREEADNCGVDIVREGEDYNILSPERRYQVLQQLDCQFYQ